jgi:hypothetical protein
VSRHWLRRMSTVGSVYYPAYRRYHDGIASRQDLRNALLHIAVIGDSLTTDFHVTSPLVALWKARTSSQGNWFLDTNSACNESIRSVFTRIDQSFPLVATQYSCPGARVDVENGVSFVERLAKVEHMSGQIGRVLMGRRFPDLTCIWIGHNSCDWVEHAKSSKLVGHDQFDAIASTFKAAFAAQIGRLIDGATRIPAPRAVIVFGLINFESFFLARSKAETIKLEDPSRYPNLEKDYDTFASLRPEYRERVISVAHKLNAAMASVVADYGRRLGDSAGLKLTYSDVFSCCDLSDVEVLNRVDAWHPSRKGHRTLAEAAMVEVTECLRYLGFEISDD